MKRFTGITLVLSGVCALFGILFLLAGSVLGAGIGDFSDLFLNGFFSTGWYKEGTVGDGKAVRKEESFPASEIEKLDFELSVGELCIEENIENPDQILVVTEVKNARVDVKQEKGCLEISEDTGKLFRNNHSGVKITVYLPRDKVYQEIDAEVSVGSMVSELENLSAQKVSLDSATGEIQVEAIEVYQDLDVECSVGSVSIKKLNVSGDVDVDCGVGEVNLDIYGQKEDFNYVLDCGIGEILIGQDSYSGLGNSTKIDYQSNKKATVDCGVGSVKLSFF